MEYKLSKLIHSLLKGTPRLPEVLHKLIIPIDRIHTNNTRKKHQVYSIREKKQLESVNSNTSHHKHGISTQIGTAPLLCLI